MKTYTIVLGRNGAYFYWWPRFTRLPVGPNDMMRYITKRRMIQLGDWYLILEVRQ